MFCDCKKWVDLFLWRSFFYLPLFNFCSVETSCIINHWANFFLKTQLRQINTITNSYCFYHTAQWTSILVYLPPICMLCSINSGLHVIPYKSWIQRFLLSSLLHLKCTSCYFKGKGHCRSVAIENQNPFTEHRLQQICDCEIRSLDEASPTTVVNSLCLPWWANRNCAKPL